MASARGTRPAGGFTPPSLARMLWGAIGLIVFFLGALAAAGPGAEAAATIATWLWHHQVVMTLAILAVLMLGLICVRPLLSRTGGDQTEGEETSTRDATVIVSPQHLAADKETVAGLRALVPRNLIRALHEHDFGNAWSGAMVRPLYELVETRNEIEDRCFHPELEERRVALHDAADLMTRHLMRCSVPTRGGGDFYELAGSEERRSEPPSGGPFERFERDRLELSADADAVVAGYDELIASARRLCP